MVSAGSDVCNLCFRDNYCSKTTAAKLFAGNQEKDKCSLLGCLCCAWQPVQRGCSLHYIYV